MSSFDTTYGGWIYGELTDPGFDPDGGYGGFDYGDDFVSEPVRTIPTSKPCFIYGADGTARDTKLAYITSVGNLTDSQPAFIISSTPIDDSQDAYIYGHGAAAELKRAYVGGHIGITDSQHAYIQSYEDVEVSDKSAYIGGISSVTDSQPAYVIGVAGDEESSKDAYVYGHYVVVASKPAYIHVAIEAFQPAYIQIESQISGSQPCYIVAYNLTEIEGPDAYLFGHYAIEEGQPSYVHIETQAQLSHACWIVGAPVEDSNACYIEGCLLAASTVGAFIQIETLISASAKRAYIVNYGLIGEWELDDGEGDYGTNVADDTSTVDNNAEIINWPEWVPGPKCG